METIEGYKAKYEKKKSIVYVRMDESMIEQLKLINKKLGISNSEIIREGVRRILKDVESSGTVQLSIK